MTDWKQAAITAGENESKAYRERDAANLRFWLLAVTLALYILVEIFK